MIMNTAYSSKNNFSNLADLSVPLKINCAGFFRVDSDPGITTFHPEGRKDYQLIYIASGKGHFVFEGKSTEDIIVSSLERHFFGKYDTIKCVFDAEIYQLYQKLSKSDFSEDLIELLRKRSPENEQILKDYNRDSFAYTYLFFDYDGHSSLANDQTLTSFP